MRIVPVALLLAAACGTRGLSELDGGTLALSLAGPLQVQLIPQSPVTGGPCLDLTGVEVTAGGVKLEPQHSCHDLTFASSADITALRSADGLPVVAEKDGERWAMTVVAPCRKRTFIIVDPSDRVLRPFQVVTMRWDLPTESDSLTASFTSPDAGPVLEAGVHVDRGQFSFEVPLFSGRSTATLSLSGNIREPIDPCEAPNCTFECGDSMFSAQTVLLEGQ